MQEVPGERAVRALRQVAQEMLPAREPRVVQERQVLLPALQRELVVPRVLRERQVRRVQSVLVPRRLLEVRCQRLVPPPGRRPHRCHLRCEREALQPRRCRLRPQEWPQ